MEYPDGALTDGHLLFTAAGLDESGRSLLTRGLLTEAERDAQRPSLELPPALTSRSKKAEVAEMALAIKRSQLTKKFNEIRYIVDTARPGAVPGAGTQKIITDSFRAEQVGDSYTLLDLPFFDRREREQFDYFDNRDKTPLELATITYAYGEKKNERLLMDALCLKFEFQSKSGGITTSYIPLSMLYLFYDLTDFDTMRYSNTGGVILFKTIRGAQEVVGLIQGRRKETEQPKRRRRSK